MIKKTTATIYYKKHQRDFNQFTEVTEIDINDYVLFANDVCTDLDKLFGAYNHLEIPVGHPLRGACEDAEHTSMSVGDVVEIDGVYYYCASSGWTVVLTKQDHRILALRARRLEHNARPISDQYLDSMNKHDLALSLEYLLGCDNLFETVHGSTLIELQEDIAHLYDRA
jgi:hypothetical protein